MVAFNKFNAFVENVAEKVHNLGADVLKILLTDVAPVAANSVKADLTEIAAGNGYTAGGVTIGSITSAQVAGLYTLDGADLTAAWTASGGSIGPFRYFVLYNDTPTSPADPLIGWWDNGGEITITTGNTINLVFDAAGILTIQ